MITGQLYRFGVNPFALSSFDGKVAMYLGEDFIHREDGITVENHKILVVGEAAPRTIDKGVLKYMEPISENR